MAVFKNAVGIPDQDAINFINAAGITSPTQLGAINRLVLDLKGFFNPSYATSNIWGKMKAVYPFIGGTVESHKWNLKDPRDLDAAFRLNFSGSWTHSSTGAKPNSTVSYANTFKTISLAEATDIAMGVYVRTNVGSDFARAIGGSSTGTPTVVFSLGNKWTYLGDNRSFLTLGANITATLPQNQPPGFFQGSRTSTTSLIFRLNDNVGSTATSTETAYAMTSNIFIGAMSTSTGLDPNSSSPDENCFSYISSGLTTAEMLNFYTAVQRFQTTLGRQV